MRAVFPLILCVLRLPLPAFQIGADETAKPAAIEGRVIEAKSGEPIGRALVILTHGDEPGTGTYTDAAGKFLFRELAPGAYTVSAERDGFVQDPETPLSTVRTKPGGTESDVALKLVRTGAVSGRVLDADGEPVAFASVQVLPTRVKKDSLAPNPGASTNDRGEYRVFHISPGKYRIAVSHTPGLDRIPDIKMQPGAGPSGAVAEEAYATTYYPGSLDTRDAVAVQVDPGADLHGLNVQLRRTQAVRIRGHVTGPAGATPGFAMVSLIPVAGKGQGRSTIVKSSNREFEISSVLRGRYLLRAEAPGQNRALTARQVLDVGETDIEGIELALAAPQKLSGRVVLPEGRRPPGGLMVLLASRERQDHQAGGMGVVGSDATFTMENVPDGDYDVMIGNAGPGDDLYIGGIRMGDSDALADGVHVAGAALPPLEIKLSPNGGTVECLVSDSNSKPTPEAQVALLPDAPRRSQMALYGECRTDAEGTCSLAGVTPGSYHVFAFQTESQLDFRDSESLKDLEKYGKPIKIAEGEKQKAELTVIPEEN
jgi:protocatechuate 3,4-dioxygenase beta subunit